MSTVNLSDLMRELQAGEEARAKVPELQTQASDLTYRLDRAQRHSQELETSILEYKRTIDGLNAKVRSLEVERDDAGFRELETQDKLTTLLNAFRGVQHDIGETILHVDPPKPEPVVEKPAEPVNIPMEGFPGNPVPGTVNVPITDHGQGQSESNPTIPTAPDATSGESALPPPSAPSTAPIQPSVSGADVKSPESVGSMIDTKPNAGKNGWQKPHDMTWADWQASGGSF